MAVILLYSYSLLSFSPAHSCSSWLAPVFIILVYHSRLDGPWFLVHNRDKQNSWIFLKNISGGKKFPPVIQPAEAELPLFHVQLCLELWSWTFSIMGILFVNRLGNPSWQFDGATCATCKTWCWQYQLFWTVNVCVTEFNNKLSTAKMSQCCFA